MKIKWIHGIGGLLDKESACQCRRRRFKSWVEKIPGRRAWQLTPVFLPGESHGQRSWRAAVREVSKSQTQLSNLGRLHTAPDKYVEWLPPFSSQRKLFCLVLRLELLLSLSFFFFAQESQAWYEWQPLRVWITSSTSVDYTQNYIGSYQERETAYIHLIFLFIKFTPWNKWKNQFSFLCFLPRNFKVFPKICITRNHSFGFIKEMGGNTFQVYKI